MDYAQYYFTTGAFARLCNVTKHTLFHYDAIGVFSPAVHAPNGYRYYSALQYDVFCVITDLRELGMSLKEIKAYMDARTPGALIDLLARQQQAIDRKIARLKTQRRILAEKCIRLRQALDATPDAVFTEPLPEATLLLSSQAPGADDRSMTLCISQLFKRSADERIATHHTLGAMQPTLAVRAGDFSAYTHFYLQLLGSRKGGYVRPAGNYLTTYHHGDFDSVKGSYQRLLAHAHARHLAIGGTFYEETVVDQLAVQDYTQYVSKLMVQLL
nr:MerR family transcriptional regulator [Maliibacterium massiliense]